MKRKNTIITTNVSTDELCSYGEIALGLGITTRKVKDMNTGLPYFTELLPTFCATKSFGYCYHFYVGFDFDDQILSEPYGRNKFEEYFHDVVKRKCDKDSEFSVSLHLVQVNGTGKPTWAQNDGMMAGYKDHCDFYYMLNDDTEMQTSGWTEIFVETLRKNNPPYLGVVGPNNSGGNTRILQYTFVHKTHIDIMGFDFPRVFTGNPLHS